MIWYQILCRKIVNWFTGRSSRMCWGMTKLKTIPFQRYINVLCFVGWVGHSGRGQNGHFSSFDGRPEPSRPLQPKVVEQKVLSFWCSTTPKEFGWISKRYGTDKPTYLSILSWSRPIKLSNDHNLTTDHHILMAEVPLDSYWRVESK